MAIVKYGCSIDILTGAGGNLGKMASCAAVAAASIFVRVITGDISRLTIAVIAVLFRWSAMSDSPT
jgi:hypothetical protein